MILKRSMSRDFGTIIVLLSMPIPGFIGYVGGTDTASIYPNMLYFCILYVAMILLFEDLMIPGFFDSIILAGLVYSCFYLSMDGLVYFKSKRR